VAIDEVALRRHGAERITWRVDVARVVAIVATAVRSGQRAATSRSWRMRVKIVSR
jgi:hypothetical protein